MQTEDRQVHLDVLIGTFNIPLDSTSFVNKGWQQTSTDDAHTVLLKGLKPHRQWTETRDTTTVDTFNSMHTTTNILCRFASVAYKMLVEVQQN